MILPNRLLIIRLGALGDIVHTLPALKPLRAALPGAHIAWMVEEPWAELLDGHPLLDEVIAIPKKRWRAGLLRPWRWPGTLGDILSKRRRVLASRFDLILDFQGNLKSGIIAVLCGGRERLGYAHSDSREWNALFMTRRVRVGPNGVHRSERCLDLVREVAGDCCYSRPDLPRRPADERFAEGFMAGISGRPIVALHPATSSFGAFKRWPVASFAAVGDTLAERRKATILITWGPGERGLAEKVARTMKAPALLAPETQRLGQLVALLRRCDLFIGADTGPTYIASALGTPVVALFGPKDPAIYGPREQPSRVVRADVPCSPCTKRKCRDRICMKAITPEAVLEAAEALLSRT